MALSANTVVEVRTAGNDTNGGAFVTGASGTDYSQQDNKNTVGSDISTTDAVANGTTTITSATANFGTTIIGNIIYLQGGTGGLAEGWYQVTARTNTTTITVDRTVATGTGITMNIGGALASPGMAGGIGVVAGNSVWIKSGTYTITSASTNISNGCVSFSVQIFVEGYNSTRGDLGTPPLLQASGISTFVIFTASQVRSSVRNIRVDGADLTSSRGFAIRALGYLLIAENCTNSGFAGSSEILCISCVATGCSTQAAFASQTGGIFSYCIAYDNTITGFSLANSGARALFCLSFGNSGASSDGFSMANVNTSAINCVAYNNGRDGFRISDSGSVFSSIAQENAGVGFNITGANAVGIQLLNNAGYDNTGGNTAGTTAKGVRNDGFVTGFAPFFTNAAGNDFTLDDNPFGGGSARAAGFPGTLTPGGTGYLDIGVLQHQDPAGSGGESSSAFFG